MDHLAHPALSTLFVLKTTFDYYVIDRFFSDATSSTSALLLHLFYSCFYMIGPYGIILCCSLKGLSFCLKVFFSGPCPIFLVWDFACLPLEISLQLTLSPIVFLLILLLMLMLSVLFLVNVISLFMFSSNLCIDSSTLSWILASSLCILFFTHTVCQRYLVDVRHNT